MADRICTARAFEGSARSAQPSKARATLRWTRAHHRESAPHATIRRRPLHPAVPAGGTLLRSGAAMRLAVTVVVWISVVSLAAQSTAQSLQHLVAQPVANGAEVAVRLGDTD